MYSTLYQLVVLFFEGITCLINQFYIVLFIIFEIRLVFATVFTVLLVYQVYYVTFKGTVQVLYRLLPFTHFLEDIPRTRLSLFQFSLNFIQKIE